MHCSVAMGLITLIYNLDIFVCTNLGNYIVDRKLRMAKRAIPESTKNPTFVSGGSGSNLARSVANGLLVVKLVVVQIFGGVR